MTQQELQAITDALVSTQEEIHTSAYSGLKNNLTDLLSLLRRALFPQVFGKNDSDCQPTAVSHRILQAHALLYDMLQAVQPDCADNEAIASAFMQRLPQIHASLATDIQAAYEGDPAACNKEEIMLAYPAFEAISVYRLAHELNKLGVSLLPRMMTEYAHQLTGIDIHPGATIGDYFFIDHGTGVVIGETTTIGHHVKLYQGVTLGAKSFELDENGNPVKGIKRHPDIGNHVIIYAGATILGGSTVIGDGCTIGGNVWLTHSVPANTTFTKDK